MQLKMWMLDLAREQAPSLDHLYQYAMLTQESGFDALGLYLEHRFAYPSTPWSHGKSCVTPEMIRSLQSEFPSLQVTPFINLLGHFEGFLYTEHGKRYCEELFQGMQACPNHPDFFQLCENLIEDVLSVFSSEIVHLGGDEAQQLGSCAKCASQVKVYTDHDGKAELLGKHFGALCHKIIQSGRRPALWGDMFLKHPSAMRHLPKETLLFDWQYHGGLKESSPQLTVQGFDVVGCPALQTYNATWMHLAQSESNVRKVIQDAVEQGLHGVCLTTWECALFGAYDTLFPALRFGGACLNNRAESSMIEFYRKESNAHAEWASLMGVELEKLGGVFAHTKIRNSLKTRLLMQGNPFMAWLYHAEELSGEAGEAALKLFENALRVAPTEAEKGVTLFARSAVEFVRLAEAARLAYSEFRPSEAIAKLAPARELFDNLTKIALRTHKRIGGSLADMERCKIAKAHVEKVIQRLRDHGNGELGYLPAFEHLTHPKFVPHDQGAWWLINQWANQ